MSSILICPESQASLLIERSGAFDDLTVGTLIEKGFSRELILSALNYTNSYDLETLANFMIKGENGWNHDFAHGENNLCKLCFDYEEQHSSYEGPNSRVPGFELNLELRDSFVLRPKENESKQIKNTCEVCFGETLEPFKLQSCQDHQICRNCVIIYLETLILEGKVVSIKCPYLDCPSAFTDDDVKGFVDDTIFKKLIRFKTNIEINRDSKAKFCTMPDCEGIVRKENDGNMQVCDTCQSCICFKCGRLWHPKKKCEKIDDKEYERWALGKEVKMCPGCDYKIEKYDGCNYMKCVKCEYQFCWLCRKKYTQNHFGNLNPFGCPNMIDLKISRWVNCKICMSRIRVYLYWIFFILLTPVFGLAIFCFRKFKQFGFGSVTEEYGRFCASLIFIGLTLLSPLIYIGLFLGLLIRGLSYFYNYIRYAEERRRLDLLLSSQVSFENREIKVI